MLALQVIRYCRSGNIREVSIFANFARRINSRIQNLAKNIIIIALLKKNENLQILNFMKSPKIRNSRKFKHVKITKSTVLLFGFVKRHILYSCWSIYRCVKPKGSCCSLEKSAVIVFWFLHVSLEIKVWFSWALCHKSKVHIVSCLW